jgi:protein gp37
MSDLFHERVYDNECSFIDEVFAVAAACPQHTFMILTKRSRIMRNYFNDPRRTMYVESALEWLYEGRIHMMPELVWPLPNVWLGVSVEDQRAAEQRIPDLLETPAAVRFVSCEPLLGPVNLGLLDCLTCGGSGEVAGDYFSDDGLSMCPDCNGQGSSDPDIDWVIAGGESGPGARPMHPDWVRGLRDQCLAGNIPFFFKQWGNWAQTYYNFLVVDKFGKKKASRLLDGKEWNEFPEIAVNE